MCKIIGMRDGNAVVITVTDGDPYTMCNGITHGYIFNDESVMAIITDDGNIIEW